MESVNSFSCHTEKVFYGEAQLKKPFEEQHNWNFLFFFARFLGLEMTCLLSECAVLPLRFQWHSWKLIGGQIICISCSVSWLCVCPWVCHSFSSSHPHPFFMYLIQAHFPHSSLLSIFLIFFSCLLTLLSNLFFLSQWETHSSFSTHSPPYIFYLNSLSVSLYRSLSNTNWFHMNHLSGCDILMTVNHVDVTLLTSVIITPWVWLNSVFS